MYGCDVRMLSVWHRFCYTAIILFVALPSNGVEVLVLARERRTHNKRERQRARGWEGRVNSEHIQILFAYLIRHTWQRHSANRIFVLLLSHTHSFTHSHTQTLCYSLTQYLRLLCKWIINIQWSHFDFTISKAGTPTRANQPNTAVMSICTTKQHV